MNEYLSKDQKNRINIHKQEKTGYGSAMTEGSKIAKGKKIIFYYSEGFTDPNDI